MSSGNITDPDIHKIQRTYTTPSCVHGVADTTEQPSHKVRAMQMKAHTSSLVTMISMHLQAAATMTLTMTTMTMITTRATTMMIMMMHDACWFHRHCVYSSTSRSVVGTWQSINS
jgi:hypothetical protein